MSLLFVPFVIVMYLFTQINTGINTKPEIRTLNFDCHQRKDHERIANYMKWTRYRLSDAIGGWYFADWTKTKHKIYTPKSLAEEYQQKWGDNIVTEYFNATNRTAEYHTLYKIVQKYKDPSRPQRGVTAVQHLRLGNTACIECWYTPTSYSAKTKKLYIFPKQYYEHILGQVVAKNVSTVIIVAATSHSNFKTIQNAASSVGNILQMAHFWRHKGFNVRVRLDCGTPDEDFIRMSNAQVFIQGGGGYSKIAGHMVRLNRGAVIFDQAYIKNLQLKAWRKAQASAGD